ncbi:MAG: hypothetical protein WEC75_01510 [Dehalococcoidia bacterium]
MKTELVRRSEQGQDLVEYAVLFGWIGIAAFMTLTLNSTISDAMTSFTQTVIGCVSFGAQGSECAMDL